MLKQKSRGPGLSLKAGLASVVLPTAYAVIELRSFEQWAERQEGGVCGLPVIGIYLVAIFGSVVLSLIAVGLGILAYRRQAGPRTVLRTIEVFVLGIPVFAAVVSGLLAAYAPAVIL